MKVYVFRLYARYVTISNHGYVKYFEKLKKGKNKNLISFTNDKQYVL